MKTSKIPSTLSKSVFQNRAVFSEVITDINKNITEVRANLLKVIQTMLQNETHLFKNDVFVTDEEERYRLKVYTVSKDVVDLVEGDTLDLSNIGTDDLYSIADGIYIELFL